MNEQSIMPEFLESIGYSVGRCGERGGYWVARKEKAGNGIKIYYNESHYTVSINANELSINGTITGLRHLVDCLIVARLCDEARLIAPDQ